MKFSRNTFCKFFILTCLKACRLVIQGLFANYIFLKCITLYLNRFKVLVSSGYFGARYLNTNRNVISSSGVVQSLNGVLPLKIVNTSKYHAGFSLLECMVAQTILLIALTVIFQFLSQVKTQLYFISQDMQAQLLLNDLSERIKIFNVSFEQVASLSSNNHQINNCQPHCLLYKNLAREIALWEQQLDTFNSATWQIYTQELAAQKLVKIKLSWKGYKHQPQQKILIHCARSKDDEI